MHSKKKIKKPQSTEVKRAQEGFVGALLETRNKKIKQAASFTLSRNVLGFGPLFLGPYSSLSRSL